MTTEEKAKAYDEALERARQIKNGENGWGYYDLTEITPALEKVFPELKKSDDERIRKHIFKFVDEQFPRHNEKEKAKMLAWLEKQKEPEQDEGDFTIYHPQKNGEGKYKCIPFSFYGSLASFSNDKDLMDFLNECFYDKEECERWCEIENKPELPECKHKIKKDSVFDYLCESSDDEKQKGQKPVVTHGETYRVDTLGTQQVIAGKMPQKPAEWSEEDEKKMIFLERLIKYNVPDGQYGWADGRKGGFVTKSEAISMLKSLRPSWKPSEEQMEILGRFNDPVLKSLREQLKKL